MRTQNVAHVSAHFRSVLPRDKFDDRSRSADWRLLALLEYCRDERTRDPFDNPAELSTFGYFNTRNRAVARAIVHLINNRRAM